jgi:hypothetical protein
MPYNTYLYPTEQTWKLLPVSTTFFGLSMWLRFYPIEGQHMQTLQACTCFGSKYANIHDFKGCQHASVLCMAADMGFAATVRSCVGRDAAKSHFASTHVTILMYGLMVR